MFQSARSEGNTLFNVLSVNTKKSLGDYEASHCQVGLFNPKCGITFPKHYVVHNFYGSSMYTTSLTTINCGTVELSVLLVQQMFGPLAVPLQQMLLFGANLFSTFKPWNYYRFFMLVLGQKMVLTKNQKFPISRQNFHI